MGSLRRSLYFGLLWRAAVGVAVAASAVRMLPRMWMAVVAGTVATLWVAWRSNAAVTQALEGLEPLAASVGASAGPHGLPEYFEMEGLTDALQVSSVEVARRLEASSESRRKLEALLDSMQDAVTSVDAAGRIVWSNKPMQRLIAEASGSVRAGRSLVQTIRAPEVLEVVKTALEKGQVAEQRSVSLPPGRVYSVSAAPMPDGGAVVVLQDVTRAEQVERTQREFVANVSHELRTPLTSISGYVETLLDDERMSAGFSSDAREFLEAIQKSARRMGRLTDDLLAMARVDSGEEKVRPQAVEVAMILDETLAAVGALVKEKGGQLEVREFPAVEVMADLDAILQVLSNLVENALNYGRPTGSRNGPEGALVELSAMLLPGGFHVQFGVRDYGAGISSEHLGRLFERFYRVDKTRSRESGGTGLGLAIARHIVESHRGRLWVESELGQGSEFCFTLPVALPERVERGG